MSRRLRRGRLGRLLLEPLRPLRRHLRRDAIHRASRGHEEAPGPFECSISLPAPSMEAIPSRATPVPT
eukprot:4439333-Pyramimonas_sp.AAC.1